MRKYVDVEYKDVDLNGEYDEFINNVIAKCFEIEGLEETRIYISIIITCDDVIRQINKKHRNIDKATDVLSFPMFEKDEIHEISTEEVLGDIVISLPRVQEQAVEYNHSFERELAYMLVHGFYHLMGEDHIQEEDKLQMRKKEEQVLNSLEITRDVENGK